MIYCITFEVFLLRNAFFFKINYVSFYLEHIQRVNCAGVDKFKWYVPSYINAFVMNVRTNKNICFDKLMKSFCIHLM